MDITILMQKLTERFPEGFKLHLFMDKDYRLDFSYTLDLFINGEWQIKVYAGILRDLIWQFEH